MNSGNVQNYCPQSLLESISNRVKSSFRDPSGYVYKQNGEILRVINKPYQKTWQALNSTSLLNKVLEAGLVIPFEKAPDSAGGLPTIKSELIPFVSYPYEWCFGQLKAAALHTLSLQILCLENGFSLKDASVYNIQFKGAKSAFIDHLSFEQRIEDKPWSGYLQFCKHFYAPLILAKYYSFPILKLFSSWIDGLPLDFASSLLPITSYLSPNIAIHIHAHAKMQAKHSDARKSSSKVKSLRISKQSVINLCQALYNSIEQTKLPQVKTEWGDYYQDTNYTEEAEAEKKALLNNIASQHPGSLAVDLGANTGVYSKILSNHYSYVIAADIDALAVEKHYQLLKKENNQKILPLVFDLGNPSPGIGWGNEERDTFQSRCQADCISALALIHHLVMTAGIPFSLVAEYFASLLKPGGILIFEFVPKEDSQVQRLLAAREDIFDDYTESTCLSAFSKYFEITERFGISESLRSIHVFKKIAK